MNRRLSLLFFLLGVLAARHTLSQASEDAVASSVLAPAELEAFVDGYMASYLEQAHIAGATVSFIEGEEIVLAKGYGWADVEARAPVEPEQTLFRIGSVSKLFVWTSVMQLVEQRKLHPLTDVNEYLQDLEVPDAYGTPVNMAQLMTHTAGFDERVIGLFAADASALRPLGDILREELPDRVRPPGELTSYSNHGVGLAMYVVEQLSGVPWEDYIEQNILEPLELSSTSFAQPLPDFLASRMSKGYRFEGGAFVARPFEFVPLAPVSAAASSATDMARFMAAHLHLGRFADGRILDGDTARLMRTNLFRHHPAVNGMAYGFMEMEMNGVRILGHGGDTELFHTVFAFFPDHDIGLFASFNTIGANYMLFLEAFVDWRFPLDEDDARPSVAASGLGRFAGSYRPTRFPQHTIAKITAFISTVAVRVEEDHLVTATPETTRWFPVGPLVFRKEGSSATMAFRETDGGRVSHLFFSEAPIIAFEPAPAAESPTLVMAVLGGSFLITITAIFFWPTAAFLRWHYGVADSLSRERRVPALGRWAAWLGSLALVGFTLGLSIALSDPMQVVYGLSPSTQSLFWLPLVAALLTAVALVGSLQAWRRQRASFVGRVAFTTVVLAMGLFLWQLDVWNLVGFNY